jgi:subtilisin family serine protease
VVPTPPSMRISAVSTAVAFLALSAGLSSASGAAKPKPWKNAPHARVTAAAGPNDPLWQSEWGPRLVRMPAAWQLRAGRRVVVAVLDTGIDADQPDLRGLVVGGWNAVDRSTDTTDDAGHGTLVAGVIAARANNAVGVAGYCRTCVVMPVKVLDASGRGNSDTITSGIDWAVAHGADVINLSLVLAARDANVSAAVARALAAGVVIVSSAGNDAGGTPAYPAAEPGVIAVAGEDPNRALYAWSGAGPWITTSAPGCNQSTGLGGSFTEFCGTSSATAAASGIVAAALARRLASPAEVRRAVAAASTGPSRSIDAVAVATALVTGR